MVEAEEFVAAVRRIALKEGRLRDSEWTAGFAASCFFGAALRWLETQDDKVQYDWKLMRRAILQRWPSEEATEGT